MAIVYGFVGYRWRSGSFAPMLPTRARRLRVPLLLRGSRLDVDIQWDRVIYSVRSGDPVTARHYGEEFTVVAGSPVTFLGDFRTHDAEPQH
jgi:alpha,alpha-trehalose phosphorylase